MAILQYEGEQPRGALEQIGSLLTQTKQEVEKKQKMKREDLMDQVKLYGSLRELGYSSEAATDRVNRTFRSTGFIESFFAGKRNNAFQQPGPEDKFGLEMEEKKATIAEKKANVGLTGAKQKYYEEGGPKRTVIDKMTPNQLQQRLKFLQKSLAIADPGSEEEQQMKLEFDYINQKIQQSAGYGGNGTETTGQFVAMVRPDGTPVKVPAENVEKALARKYRKR